MRVFDLLVFTVVHATSSFTAAVQPSGLAATIIPGPDAAPVIIGGCKIVPNPRFLIRDSPVECRESGGWCTLDAVTGRCYQVKLQNGQLVQQSWLHTSSRNGLRCRGCRCARADYSEGNVGEHPKGWYEAGGAAQPGGEHRQGSVRAGRRLRDGERSDGARAEGGRKVPGETLSDEDFAQVLLMPESDLRANMNPHP